MASSRSLNLTHHDVNNNNNYNPASSSADDAFDFSTPPQQSSLLRSNNNNAQQQIVSSSSDASADFFGLHLSGTEEEDDEFAACEEHEDDFLDDKKSCTCKDCGKIFNSFWYLKQHAVKHSAERPFKCKLCSKTYRFRSNLYQHKCPLRDALGLSNSPLGPSTTTIFDNIGGGSLTTSSNTNNCLTSSTRGGRTPRSSRNRCDDSATAESNNNTNAVSSSSPRRHEDYSTTTTTTPYGGRRRRTSAQTTSPQIAAVSPRRTLLATRVQQQLLRRREKPTATPPTPEELKKFVQKHSSELHRCTRCRVYFPSREYLARHVAWHDDLEARQRTKCSLCSETYEDEQLYGLHKQLHVPASPHVCPACRGKFCHRVALKKHMNKCTARRRHRDAAGSTNAVSAATDDTFYTHAAWFFDRTPPPSSSSPSLTDDNNNATASTNEVVKGVDKTMTNVAKSSMLQNMGMEVEEDEDDKGGQTVVDQSSFMLLTENGSRMDTTSAAADVFGCSLWHRLSETFMGGGDGTAALSTNASSVAAADDDDADDSPSPNLFTDQHQRQTDNDESYNFRADGFDSELVLHNGTNDEVAGAENGLALDHQHRSSLSSNDQNGSNIFSSYVVPCFDSRPPPPLIYNVKQAGMNMVPKKSCQMVVINGGSPTAQLALGYESSLNAHDYVYSQRPSFQHRFMSRTHMTQPFDDDHLASDLLCGTAGQPDNLLDHYVIAPISESRFLYSSDDPSSYDFPLRADTPTVAAVASQFLADHHQQQPVLFNDAYGGGSGDDASSSSAGGQSRPSSAPRQQPVVVVDFCHRLLPGEDDATTASFRFKRCKLEHDTTTTTTKMDARKTCKTTTTAKRHNSFRCDACSNTFRTANALHLHLIRGHALENSEVIPYSSQPVEQNADTGSFLQHGLLPTLYPPPAANHCPSGYDESVPPPPPSEYHRHEQQTAYHENSNDVQLSSSLVCRLCQRTFRRRDLLQKHACRASQAAAAPVQQRRRQQKVTTALLAITTTTTTTKMPQPEVGGGQAKVDSSPCSGNALSSAADNDHRCLTAAAADLSGGGGGREIGVKNAAKDDDHHHQDDHGQTTTLTTTTFIIVPPPKPKPRRSGRDRRPVALWDSSLEAAAAARPSEATKNSIAKTLRNTKPEECKCRYCPKTFFYKRYLRKHERLQHELPRERHGESSSLVYHLKNADMYKIRCPLCVKRFSSQRLLKQHLSFHNRANRLIDEDNDEQANQD